MNIILCGLPMSGKTTVGKILAQKLDWTFIDTDLLIEKTYAEKNGKILSCRQIFLVEGETSFRQLEMQQVASLPGCEESVISLGGGALMLSSNVETVREIGFIFYLKTSSEILWERIHTHGIPAYLDPINSKKAFQKLIHDRIPIYEKVSNTTIETDLLQEEEIAATIMNNLKISTRYGCK